MSSNNQFPGFPDFGNFGKGRAGRSSAAKPQLPKFKKPGPLGITVIILAALLLFIVLMAGLWTEVLWYKQLGYLQILFTQWGSAALMGLVGFVLAFVIVVVNIFLAVRSMKPGRSAASVSEYSRQIISHPKIFTFGIAALVGIYSVLKLAPSWSVLQVALNSTPFGKKDPIWGFDLSFFTFQLPLLDLLSSAILAMVATAAVATAVIYYLGGAIQVTPKVHVRRGARIHLGILAGILSLLVGLRYIVGRFNMLAQQGGPTDGAMYTDINAALPANTILAVISALIAILFFVAAFKGTWRLPVAGLVVLVVSSLVIGFGYPMLMQRFKVDPNAKALESTYIQHNIDATLAAFGMDDLEYKTTSATTKAEAGQLAEDQASTSQIRLLDPEIISPTVRQLQQSRPYYTFPEQFAVDRYKVDGEKADTVIAVRDINQEGLSQGQRTWVNDHTVYTHGFGAVAAFGNKVTPDGLPAYWEHSIPSRGKMGDYEPRIYFSPQSPQYSVVGAPKGSAPQELDYPDDNAESGQVNNTFQGNGGPSLGNFWNKFLYALRFQSTDLFFSDQVNEKSQILYDRDPSLRVAKAAPYLTLDRKPYPAVVDVDGDPKTPKRLVWIVDGYTTSNAYPYAEHVSVDSVTDDSRTNDEEQFTPRSQINYMRNSVKAVVDAYDGSVSLYQWDKQDPVLRTWQKVFPGKIKPISEISGDLMAHLRYPEDLFKVQRKLLETYHVTQAEKFYTGGDQWKLSEDPTVSVPKNESAPVQPPYYLTMKMPSQPSAEFSLTSVFIPGGGSKRAAMAGFLAVDSETGSEAGKVREGYGKLRLMALPSSTTVPGPGQVQNNFNSDQRVSKELNLQDQQGTKVLRGNLLTLPVGGGLLYIQPVYVQSTGTTSYPQLRSVLTSFGDKVGFASTLEESLNQVFGGDAAASTSSVIGGEGAKKPTAEKVEQSADQKLQSALQDAKAALDSGGKALSNQNWSEYGKSQEALKKALEEAVKADQERAKAKTK